MGILNVFRRLDPRIDFTGKYRAMDVAEYIVSKCSRERHQISNLQLQKILYYIPRDKSAVSVRLEFAEQTGS